MTEQITSQEVYKSRDQIRSQITDFLQTYLELENVDLTKSSFLSFMVETLSTITSNVLFYQISTYKEFFLTKAQLPESIHELAAYLGYSAETATPAVVDVLFSVPLTFDDNDASFTLAEGFQVKGTDNIIFSSYWSTEVTVTNNASVRVVLTEGTKVFIMPVTVTNQIAYFVLPFRQFSTNEQEFQINEDLQVYQFISLDVEISGEIAEIEVQVKEPGQAGYTTYIEVASLFLMEATTKGYVVRRTDDGFRLQFGNGLIGYQPPGGSTVLVTTQLTDGEDGNVVAATISQGDRIYTTTVAGQNQVVNYNITNTGPAINGEDEESLNEIRRNAITNLTALERLVSENDYVNANVVIDDSPLNQNSLPVLKRSDIKVNEISLFTTLNFNGEIVPSRNVYQEFTSLYIPKQTIINHRGDEYYTIFDMYIEALNTIATYEYILTEIEQIPTLITSYGSSYDLTASLLTVTQVGSAAEFVLSYRTTEDDYSLAECEIEILETGQDYDMINDTTAEQFIITFPDYTVLPSNENTYYFNISQPSEGLIGQYQATFIFRQDLSDFSTSNVVDSDTTGFIVYDIPVIKKEWYDSIDTTLFETTVLQKLITEVTFKDYKMLTDFVNFKLANTTGEMENMQLNDVDMLPVIDILSDPPTSGSLGNRYIVLNGQGVFANQDNNIAVINDATAMTFTFITPKSDQTVFITNKNKKYIFSVFGWVVPNYDIPLILEIDVFKSSTYSGTNGNLSDAVQDAVIEDFTSRFGINKNIYRSEIIDVVQEVVGVDHVVLRQPESSIFFNFDINDFDQETLLRYGPEYVYFDEDNMIIRIFS
jgi:hypothetical protein